MNDCPGGQWRIHYHLPLFVESFGALASTREETRTVLNLLKAHVFCPHLEIETYTWEWLPSGLKHELLEFLTEEYRWVLAVMAEGLEMDRGETGAAANGKPLEKICGFLPLSNR